jgi:lipid-binding SYLF domain-containing protein
MKELAMMRMTTASALRGTLLGAALLLAGCTSPMAKDESDRATLASESSAAMDAFTNEDPTLQPLLDKAVGYAVFPEVGKAGFIAGGSYGKGEVFEKGVKVGYADITQATFGLQAGAQTFGELILFMTPEELNAFKGGEYKLAGNVSAVAIKAGAAGTADASKGVIAFVRTKGGLMAEASVGGQRFRYRPLDAAANGR